MSMIPCPNPNAVNETGISTPPLFVFLEKYRKYAFTNGPTRYLGSAKQSGWRNSDDLFNFIIKHIRCTVECLVLLLLDNLGAHLSVKGIDMLNSVRG